MFQFFLNSVIACRKRTQNTFVLAQHRYNGVESEFQLLHSFDPCRTTARAGSSSRVSLDAWKKLFLICFAPRVLVQVTRICRAASGTLLSVFRN